ncbi:MAG TPA: hypothetical protein VMW17_00350 [Candidatus Binatia bacterium]|nr:hypothetical protein [Candidatus Binatia bacterium]
MTIGVEGRAGAVWRWAIVCLWCASLSLVPSAARGDWSEFAPRSLENGAFFDAYTSYERDNLTSNGRTTNWHDTFFRERISLYSDGYSYHPRFVQYHFSIAGSLRQENYENSTIGDQGWQDSTGFEYDLALHFLPEHPYNLSLFAARFEPVVPELSASTSTAVQDHYAVLFRYKERPYAARSSYIYDDYDYGSVTSRVSKYSLDGDYVNQFGATDMFALTGAFNPSWFSNSTGLDGDSMEYLASNTIRWDRLRVYNTFNYDTFHQSDPQSTDFDSDQLGAYTLWTAYLPLNFRSDASYRYQDNSSSTDLATGPAQSSFNRNKTIFFDIYHRLYESLDTNYILQHSDQNSAGGEVTTLGNSLTFNYAKLIPQGRLLSGLSLGRTDTDSSGSAVSVVLEPHANVAVPPGTFTLDQQNVVQSSINVYLSVEAPTPEIIYMAPSTYLVSPAPNNTVEIRVIALPPHDPPFAIPGTFTFLVSYDISPGNFELRTDSLAANVSAQLYNNVFNPYFSYLVVQSDVLSGTFSGTPIDSTTYTAGMVVNYPPWRLLGEFQDFHWSVGPYRSWRSEAQYVAELNDTTSLYATASYLNKDYYNGQSGYSNGPYTEETEIFGANVQKQFFSRRLVVGGGGSYTHVSSLVDTDGYSTYGSLTWHIGKFDLIAGGTAYGYDSSGSTITTQNRDHQRFYLTVRRRLF